MSLFGIYKWKNAPMFLYRVRISGIDTPELKPLHSDPNREHTKQMAIKAREALRSMIPLSGIIQLECMGFEKYGRLLARVIADNIDLGEKLIEQGYAKRYNGGAKDRMT